jgi:hypothetical protein
VGRPRLSKSAGLAAFGSAGLLTGHLLDYLSVFPGRQARTLALAASGHAYLRHVLLVTTCLAVIFGGFAFVSAIRDARKRLSESLSISDLFLRIMVIQIIGFVLLEVGERLLSGSSFDAALLAILGVGLVIQAGVAFVGAVLLAGLELAGQALGHALAKRTTRPQGIARGLLESSFRRSRPFVVEIYAPRAPPEILLA